MCSTAFCQPAPLRVNAWKETGVCEMDGFKRTTGIRMGNMSFGSRSKAAIAAFTLFASSSLNPAMAIISAPPCIKGEGPGCEASAVESEVIRDLLERSRANREKTDKAVLEKYWEQGYGDYFSYGYNKELKKNEDGKWSLETPDDLFSSIQGRLRALAKKDK